MYTRTQPGQKSQHTLVTLAPTPSEGWGGNGSRCGCDAPIGLDDRLESIFV